MPAGNHMHPMLAASHIRPVERVRNPSAFAFRERPGEDPKRTVGRLAFRWLPDREYIRPLLDGEVEIEPADDGWLIARARQ